MQLSAKSLAFSEEDMKLEFGMVSIEPELCTIVWPPYLVNEPYVQITGELVPKYEENIGTFNNLIPKGGLTPEHVAKLKNKYMNKYIGLSFVPGFPAFGIEDVFLPLPPDDPEWWEENLGTMYEEGTVYLTKVWSGDFTAVPSSSLGKIASYKWKLDDKACDGENCVVKGDGSKVHVAFNVPESIKKDVKLQRVQDYSYSGYSLEVAVTPTYDPSYIVAKERSGMVCFTYAVWDVYIEDDTTFKKQMKKKRELYVWKVFLPKLARVLQKAMGKPKPMPFPPGGPPPVDWKQIMNAYLKNPESASRELKRQMEEMLRTSPKNFYRGTKSGLRSWEKKLAALRRTQAR